MYREIGRAGKSQSKRALCNWVVYWEIPEGAWGKEKASMIGERT